MLSFLALFVLEKPRDAALSGTIRKRVVQGRRGLPSLGQIPSLCAGAAQLHANLARKFDDWNHSVGARFADRHLTCVRAGNSGWAQQGKTDSQTALATGTDDQQYRPCGGGAEEAGDIEAAMFSGVRGWACLR